MSARGLWSVVLLAFLLVVVGVPVPFAAGAGELVVDTLGDAGDGSCDPGSCTLRDALIEANGNPDANTITFALDGTIILQDSLTVGNDLTIDATGRDITISGNDQHRVIHLVAGDTIPVLEIRSLAIIEGESGPEDGGGILNDGGELIILDSLFSGNRARYGGGVYNNGGDVTVERSTFSDNQATIQGGGGLFNSIGAMTIERSTFSDNLGNHAGGGISNEDGTMTIVDSTFARNSADSGGGFYQRGGTSVVINSTFSENDGDTGGGGLYLFDSSMTVVNSTIALNSAALFGAVWHDGQAGTLTLTNSVVASNVGGGNCSGSIVNGGNNIEDGTSCGWGSGNGSLSNTDPLLGSLADNGGPTQTHALLPGSPAIDGVGFNAPNDCPLTDQRGVPRLQGAACDMGAVEYVNPQPGPNLVVNTLADKDDGVCEPLIPGLADCTLREAIVFANSNPDANTITFALDGTITLQDSLTVGNDVTIDGTGRDIMLSGNNQHRVIHLVAGDAIPILEIRSLAIVEGSAQSGGGVLNDGGELIILDSLFSSNYTDLMGAGVYNNSGAVTIERSNFSDNSTEGSGGGLYNAGGTLTVVDSTFAKNSSDVGVGGGLYQSDGTTVVTNSTFSSNAALYSGGLHLHDGSMTVVNSTITLNSSLEAAGIRKSDSPNSTLTLTNTIVAANSSENCGGVIVNGGNNIEDGTSCGWGSGNGSLSDTNPQLGPLADNGGPTQTHALLPGSPAIDGVGFNAPNDCPAADQRGVMRPQGTSCDIGAFELEQTPPHEGFLLNLPVVLANAGQ